MKTKHIFSSSIFLTVFFTLCWVGLALLICACPTSNDEPDPQSIVEPDPTPSGDGKTYVSFTNQTQYKVNVYVGAPPTEDSVPFSEIPASSTSERWEISPSQTDMGDTFYFEYIIPFSSIIQLPYYHKDNVKIRKILAGQTTTITVEDLNFVSTNSVLLVIENKHSSDPIWLARGGNAQYPVGLEHEETTRNIEAGETAVYRFTSLSDLNNLSIRHNTATKPLPQYVCETNKIYLVRYEQNTPSLFQVQPFDPTMKEKMWNMPTGSIAGQHLVIGFVAPRLNPADGYLALGKVTYFPDLSADPNVQSKGYFAAISQTGDITTEKFVTLPNTAGTPTMINFRRFIEYPDELIFYGQVYYGDGAGKPFLWSTNITGSRTNYYNANFIDDIDPDTEYMYSYRMVKRNDNVYATGGTIENTTTGIYSAFITEVTKTDFDEVSFELLWRSDEDVDICDLIYDQIANRYIVTAIGYDGNEIVASYLYIIDAETGEQRVKQEFNGRYLINALAAYEGSYYAAGTYENAGSMQGFLRKLNPSTGAFEWNMPVFFDYNGTADAAIKCLTVDDNKLILGGWANLYEDDGPNDAGTLPYLIGFDMNAKTILWENVYKDIWTSEVYSVNPNGIGSYVAEFYNEEKSMSRLVSTGLMGELNANRKPAIPNDPSLTVIAPSKVIPGIRINPLEDAELESTEVEIAKGQSQSISVTGSYSAYEWYLDGVKQVGTSSSYTVATASMMPGVHTLTVVVTDSASGKRSASCRITVKN
jgi:hypothetical protein